jgi:phosphoribosylformylglycinamidine synthase I
MKAVVVTFPGSNCDADARHACALAGMDVVAAWHKDASLPADTNFVVLPGGFSYGDYLRTGAIARFSPIMADVIRFANEGGLVLGVCNGFQILCESGLLPGALVRNAGLSFVCKDVFLRTENASTPFTTALTKHQLLRIPIAHGEGRYVADADVIHQLEANNQIAFRYCTADGHVEPSANPNGSTNNIAGIVNFDGNVLGMMPHPERYSETLLGSADGMNVFASLVQHHATQMAPNLVSSQ